MANDLFKLYVNGGQVDSVSGRVLTGAAAMAQAWGASEDRRRQAVWRISPERLAQLITDQTPKLLMQV